MKKKELEKIAARIAQAELVLSNKLTSEEGRQQAENEIFQLTNKVMREGYECMDIVDEMVQTILANS